MIEAETFQNLPRLPTLDLHDQQLETLPESFFVG